MDSTFPLCSFTTGIAGSLQARGRSCAASVAALVVALALAGPAGAAESTPQRIISLAPSLTEVLFALGLGPNVVGVSTRSDFPPEARQVKRVGSFLSPSVEAIVARHPDLVVAVPSPGNQDAVKAIDRMGIRVEIVRDGSLTEIQEAIRRIGALTGKEAQARELISAIDRELARVKRRLAGVAARKVLVVVGRNPLVAAGPRTFLGELVERAGGVNVAPRRTRWPVVNVETVIAADPDVIIDISMGSERDDGKAAYRFWSSFPSLRAVRENRVIATSSDRLLRPGPRLAEGVAELARLIHPERF